MVGPDRKRVAVTGVGVVSPLGNDTSASWQSLLKGETGAAPIRQFDATGWPVQIGCEVKGFRLQDPQFQDARRISNRPTDFGLQAAWEAMTTSGLVGGMDLRRFAVFVGAGNDAISPQTIVDLLRGYQFDNNLRGLATFLEHQNPPNALMDANHPGSLAALLAERWQAQAGYTTIETACAAGAQAIGHGYREIQSGAAEYVLACGADSLAGELLYAGFCLLGVLSPEVDDPKSASKPFDISRNGFVAGEGAAALVLEEWSHAVKRGAKILAEVVGFGESANAYRVTDLPEDGRGAILSMRAALASAGLQPAAINYINAHGTGTAQNDVVEGRAIREVFIKQGASPAISSTKAATGHLIAAAGSIECVFSVMALRDGVAPTTLNFQRTDCGDDLRILSGPANPIDMQYVMSNSFGFGGTNASLVLKRAP